MLHEHKNAKLIIFFFLFSDSVSKLPTVKKVWGKEGRIVDTKETEKEEEDHITEVDRNRQQMVSALFGGITPGQVNSFQIHIINCLI